MAQDGDAKGDDHDREHEEVIRISQQAVQRVRLMQWGDQYIGQPEQLVDANEQEEAVQDPLGLLALHWCGDPSIAIDLVGTDTHKQAREQESSDLLGKKSF